MREGQKADLNLTDVWRVIDKFKNSVMRRGLNLYEHFKKYDPNGEDLISEYFFRKVILVCLRNEVPMSEDEINTLTEFFRYRDGRIFYMELCDRVHDKMVEMKTGERANMMTGLEWEDPRHVNALTLQELEKLDKILEKIAEVLTAAEVPIDIHFKDYEQIARNPGCVSWDHLARVFQSMDVKLVSSDFNLLAKRYTRHNFMFNYIPFLEDLMRATKIMGEKTGGSVWVDSRYYIDISPDRVSRPDITVPISKTRGMELGKPVSFRLLTTYPYKIEGPIMTMRRIKRHVFIYGIDLFYLFLEVDPHKTGVVTEENFYRVISAAGINCGIASRLHLEDEDLKHIVQIYQRPYDIDAFMWRLFVKDVESSLIKNTITPESKDKDSELNYIPSQGNVWDRTPEHIREHCELTLEKLRNLMNSRRWTMKQFFIVWDPCSTGNVSIGTFRSVLSSHNLITDPKDLEALEKRYANAGGFDYFKLIDELRLTEREPKLKREITGLADDVSSVTESVRESSCDIKPINTDSYSDTLCKVRRQVVVHGRKLDDYMKQFDNKNHRTIWKNEFLRSLTMAKIDITPEEGVILTKMFQSPMDPNKVDYARFLDTVDEAFTQKNLEKAPLIVPVKHVAVIDGPSKFLDLDERRHVERAIDLLSDKLFMIHFDDFRNYDPTRCGAHTENQLSRLLDSFKLKLSPPQVSALMKAFGKKVGQGFLLEYLPLLKVLDAHYREKRMSS